MYLFRVLAFSILATIFIGFIFVSCDSQINEPIDEDQKIEMV